TIIGPPGIGKSRLVSELAGSLAETVLWRQGRCLPYGEGITYWALGEILKSHSRILESDPPEVAGSKLDRVLAEGEDRGWIRERLLPLVGVQSSSTGERKELFTAWRRFLESLGE